MAEDVRTIARSIYVLEKGRNLLQMSTIEAEFRLSFSRESRTRQSVTRQL